MQVYFLENENPFRDSSGGIMTYLMNLSRHLKTKGVETILLGSGNSEQVERIFSRYIPVCTNPVVSNPRYLMSLFKLLPKLDIDKKAIIHAQRPDMLVPAAICKAKNPLVISLHGAHDMAVFDKKGRLYGWVYRILQFAAFKKSSALIAVDKQTSEHYARMYPWAKSKLTTIPIGVDMELFRPGSGEKLRNHLGIGIEDKVVLFVGRLEKEKNLPFLVKAFERISEQILHSHFLIIGKGREEQALRSEVRDRGLKSIMLLGEVNHDSIPDYMNLADVFVLGSHYEGSPNTIKEALACNTPVVSVDVGDVAQVLAGLEGCYIAKKNVEDFAEKLEVVLNSEMSINTREKMRSFSKENIGKLTFDLYSSLL